MRRLTVIAAALLAAAAVAATTRADDHLAHHDSAKASKLARQIARARVALAPFATNLRRAQRRGGYRLQITPMMPGMGFHYMNPAVTEFDVRKPPILVYERHGGRWQLGALEWVFPETPATPPLKGATYGSFPAACHYKDGTFVPQPSQDLCAPKSPESGSPFNFWHPQLVTLHVWIWYPNPDGMYASMNPLVDAFS